MVAPPHFTFKCDLFSALPRATGLKCSAFDLFSPSARFLRDRWRMLFSKALACLLLNRFLYGAHMRSELSILSLSVFVYCVFFLRNLSALSSCCVSLWEPWQRLTPLLPLLSYQVLVNNFVLFLSLAPFHKQQKKRKEKRFISLMCQYSLVDDLPLHFVRKFCKWGPGVKISPFAI